MGLSPPISEERARLLVRVLAAAHEAHERKRQAREWLESLSDAHLAREKRHDPERLVSMYTFATEIEHLRAFMASSARGPFG